MSGDKSPPSLKDLDARLREAFARRRERRERTGRKDREGGLALAFRIGVELVAALIVGTGIGLLLDAWLGTKPWLLVLFFFLGAAAGILNVYRTMSGYGYSAGYRPAGRQDHERGGEEGK